MKISKVNTAIHQIVAAYKAKSDHYPEAVFQATPPIAGWSYSEVYSHIFDSSILSVMALENCIAGKAEQQKTAFAVKLILFFGSLPPQKYKVPSRLADRVKKITKVEALSFIHQFENALTKAHPGIAQADANQKTKHPRLGYLNAKQWLRFIEIHLKHHLKQLNRIEKSFLHSI